MCLLDRILLQALPIFRELMRRCRGCCFNCLCLLPVCEMKSPSMSDFLTGLENSGWLRHIKAVMDAGVFLAKVKLLSSCSCVPKCLLVWLGTAAGLGRWLWGEGVVQVGLISPKMLGCVAAGQIQVLCSTRVLLELIWNIRSQNVNKWPL